MSKQFSRAAFFTRPTTLTETGDRSPKGFGYINTGTRSGPITMQGGGQPYMQAGADSNRGQAVQAYNGFMETRKATLHTAFETGRAEEHRANRGQAKMRLRGEVF